MSDVRREMGRGRVGHLRLLLSSGGVGRRVCNLGWLEDVAEERVTSTEEIESVRLGEDKYHADEADTHAGHPGQKHKTANDCGGYQRGNAYGASVMESQPQHASDNCKWDEGDKKNEGDENLCSDGCDQTKYKAKQEIEGDFAGVCRNHRAKTAECVEMLRSSRARNGRARSRRSR